MMGLLLFRSAADEGARVLSPFVGAKRTLSLRVLGGLLIPVTCLFCVIYGMLFAFTAPYLMVFFAIPLLALGLLAIWALPDTGKAPTRATSRLLFTFTLALVLWPNYLAIALPGLPWITMIRLFSFPLCIALLICVAVSPAFRREMASTLAAAPALVSLVVAFSLIELTTVIFSKDPAFSLQRVVIQEIDWTGVFFASCYVFSKPKRADLWAIMLCASAVPVVLIALRENQMEQLPWVGHIPGFLRIQTDDVNRILSGAHREDGPYRVQSVFSTPLGLSEYAALVMPFLIHYMVSSRTRLLLKAGIAGLALLLIYIVLLTDSRLGLIGCFMAGLLSLLFWGIQRWRNVRPSLFGPAVTLAYPLAAAAAYASTIFIGRIREKVWGSGQYDDSTEARAKMYHDGIPMVLNHPWGYGPGMGAEQLGYRNASGVLTIDTYYVAIALDYGVLGFLTFYGIFILAAGKAGEIALKSETAGSETSLLAPIAIALANFIVIKSVFSNEDNHPLVFIMLGMLVALLHRKKVASASALREAQAS